jgi:hypothetical protein
MAMRFTEPLPSCAILRACARVAPVGGEIVMAFIAMVMFVALFAFGQSYFGWADPNGHIQLALFSAFLFGIICGFRVKD